jgi:hypothetical protein
MATTVTTTPSHTREEFLIDRFLEEVAEGRMPSEDSPERRAYEDYRTVELDRTRRVVRVQYAGRHRA